MEEYQIPVSNRASSIEYAIRDVVVPATKLELEGHKILKLNIGDPIAYPGLPTPKHMVEAYVDALRDGKNGYSPSYGIPKLDLLLLMMNEEKAGMLVRMMSTFVMVLPKHCRLFLPQLLKMETKFWPLAHTILLTWHILKCLELKL